MYIRLRDKEEENRWSSIQQTHGVLTSYVNVRESHSALSRNIDILQNMMARYIEKNTEAITLNDLKEGKTTELQKTEDVLVEKMMELIYQSRSWANHYGDEEAKRIVRISRTKLSKERDTILIVRCTEICDLIEQNAAALAEYNITADKITASRPLLTHYSTTMTDRDTTEKNMMAAHNKCHVELDKILAFLQDEIDPIVAGMKEQFPEFHNAYFSARVISNRGSGHAPQAEDPPPE